MVERDHGGFTLLELMTVMVVIAILITMLLPAAERLKGRAERMNCASNLGALYIAASAYIQDHGHWPQVPSSLIRGSPRLYANTWIEKFAPYKISRVNWICPTIQRVSGEPDYRVSKNHRIDYLATPFDDHYSTPYRWATQPWFVERGNVHGRGNQLIYSSGKVESLLDVQQSIGSGP